MLHRTLRKKDWLLIFCKGQNKGDLFFTALLRLYQDKELKRMWKQIHRLKRRLFKMSENNFTNTVESCLRGWMHLSQQRP